MNRAIKIWFAPLDLSPCGVYDRICIGERNVKNVNVDHEQIGNANAAVLSGFRYDLYLGIGDEI